MPSASPHRMVLRPERLRGAVAPSATSPSQEPNRFNLGGLSHSDLKHHKANRGRRKQTDLVDTRVRKVCGAPARGEPEPRPPFSRRARQGLPSGGRQGGSRSKPCRGVTPLGVGAPCGQLGSYAAAVLTINSLGNSFGNSPGNLLANLLARQDSYREADQQHIAGNDLIVLSLNSDLTGAFCLVPTTGRNNRFDRRNLGTNEPAFEIRVNLSGCLRS